jgi:radical SAM superfamily enzyme YgiQ (UPF0313 family)
MELLLTHGYFLSEDPKELEIRKPYPPLGILYLSSYLRAKGFDVEIHDSTFSSFDALAGRLSSTPPSTLGVYSTLLTRPSAVRIIRHAKAHGWRVIAGGPEPANHPQEFLDSGADLVVEGEGEVTLEELLSGAAPARTPGVHLRGEGGQAVFTGPRPQLADLDAQPWPDRPRIDLEQYLSCWRKAHGKSSLNIITARGCPYRCRWCSHSTFGMTHRRRSPAGVAEEVAHVLERHSPEQLWIADDVFTIHPGWIEKYANEIERRGIRTPFECITRADRLDERMADALARLGAFRVWIGSESGSQRILDAMERGVKVEQVRRAVELLRARDIASGMFLMWGYEGEQIADIEATVAHLEACLPDVFFTTVSYPIKGTPYFDEVAGRLAADEPWEARTERQWRIRGRPSRRFYSFADDLLKSSVQRRRLALSGRQDGALDSRIDAARKALYALSGDLEA